MTKVSGSTKWRMVAIAFIAQNCALGMAVGAYGTAISVIQEELGATRAAASSAIGVMLLSLGLLSPLVGNLLRRVSIRTAMTWGVILNGIGYVIVAYANNFTEILLVYGLLIGPGACLLGPLTASTLVSRWFDADRGKALGVANMPLFLLTTPPIAALLVLHGGRHLLFLALAGVFLLLLPLVRLVKDAPAVSEHPDSINVAAGKTKIIGGNPGVSIRDLLSDPRFWLLSLAMGVVTGAGTAFVSHAVPLATSKGIELAAGSTLISIYGAGTLVGAVVFGWLIDRIGPFPSLALNTGIQIALWMLLIPFVTLPGLLAVSAVIGCCMGAAVALHSAALNELFGPATFSRAMGFSYFIKVPFLFGSAPLFGLMFDQYASYHSALLGTGLGMLVITVIFASMAMTGKLFARKPAG